MNTTQAEKFMSLFDEILEGRTAKKTIGKAKAEDNVLKLLPKGDDVDQVTAQKENQLNQRLNQRNILFLRKVEAAKERILDGSYGTCDDCGESISEQRLLARPTACMCINCQDEKERGELHNFKKRRDLKTNKGEESVGEGTEFDHISTKLKFGKMRDIGFEGVMDL